ncbi:hypothetical protein [Brevibacterium sp.]|uniref:hypothetical protein n=1 Tax=Brevibacterium sp. TaxID=1701 RepID=UPI002810BC3B|nr:hypothetical protein [Brevibacterium sp.]
MKKRLILLAGLGVGYVLGSRTGRQSYERLKAQVQELWSDPRVQDTVDKANQSIRDKAPGVADAVQSAADKVTSAAAAGAAGAASGGVGGAEGGGDAAEETGHNAETTGGAADKPDAGSGPVRSVSGANADAGSGSAGSQGSGTDIPKPSDLNRHDSKPKPSSAAATGAAGKPGSSSGGAGKSDSSSDDSPSGRIAGGGGVSGIGTVVSGNSGSATPNFDVEKDGAADAIAGKKSRDIHGDPTRHFDDEGPSGVADDD